MATSVPRSNESSDRILVKGIPPTINADKVTIYFQRRKTGGGDVRSVTFPVSNSEPDTAIVIFEDPATVQTVLQNNHKIGGKAVTVTALQPQPEIFENINAKISRFVVEKISSSSEDIDEVLENVTDATGCSIDQKEGTYVVKGEWYQIQAAFDMLQGLVSKGLEKPPPSSPAPPPRSTNGYLSSPFVPRQTPVPTPAPARNVVSTMIDKDIYSYMLKMHQMDLNKIKKQSMVDFKMINIGGDATKIEVTPLAVNSDPEVATKALEELSQKLQADAGQDVVEIDPRIPPSAVENIFSQLRPEFPQIHMDRVDASPNQIIIIAPNSEKCRMASEMLKHYLSMESTSLPPSTPDAAGEKNTIDVDKDILQFVQRVDGNTLRRIWETCGAKINVHTIGDCAKIEVVSRGSTMPFRPQDAIDQFQKIYSHANDKAVQEMFDLETLKEPVSGEGIFEAIRVTSNAHRRVHLSQMVEEKSKVLFIANSKAECNAAMGLFHKLVGGGN